MLAIAPEVVAEVSPIVEVISLNSKEEIEAYIVKRAIETGIPVDRALHVAKAESHLEPNATGDLSLICKRTGEAVYARGIYQLTRCYYPQVSDETAFDAKKNIDYVFDNGLLKEGTCQSQFSTCK